MSRWNVKNLHFYSNDGNRRRDLEFKIGAVNIITGESGTGKTAIWKVIDYCLFSRKNRVPHYISERCSVVGVEWVKDGAQLLVFRRLSEKGFGKSPRAYVTYGKGLVAPARVGDLEGGMSVDNARDIIAGILGLGDVDQPKLVQEEKKGKLSIRHLTPYLFLTGSVVVSDSLVFHGMEDSRKAEGVKTTLDYFLRVVDEESLAAESRLRQLRKAAEALLRRRASLEQGAKNLEGEAQSLLFEARQVGIPLAAGEGESVIEHLEAIVKWRPSDPIEPSESELESLYTRQARLLEELRAAQRQRRAAADITREAEDYISAVGRQTAKLRVAELVREDAVGHTCPVCESKVNSPTRALKAIKRAFHELSEQGDASRRYAPRLERAVGDLEERIMRLRQEKASVDAAIESLIREAQNVEDMKRATERAAHVVGRISYFLERLPSGGDEKITEEVRRLEEEIEWLQERWNPELRDQERQEAEQEIVTDMNEIIGVLPTRTPLTGGRLYFSAKTTDVWLRDARGSKVNLVQIGSDENYLAIHIALICALHRLFARRGSPVPGVVVVDQVSRPYFPQDIKEEVELTEEVDDPDMDALRRHMAFLFQEVRRDEGLQVILLEHAYFSGSPEYVDATRERWTRATGKKLIPDDWPVA